MQQIMINLVQNSIKFSKENDKITVTINRRMTPDQNFSYQVAVSDQGMGISEEDRKNLFQPFFKSKDKKS